MPIILVWECDSGSGACEVVNEAKCNPAEWSALKAFYTVTNGDSWTNKTGWDTIVAQQTTIPNNCDLGKLYGVTIDTAGRVKTINLEKNNLSGYIPDHIQVLNYLETLQLNDNLLEGNIPPQLSALKRLSELNLSNNQLSGCYPPSLFLLCDQLNTKSNINTGNNFEKTWEELCENDLGVCDSRPNCHRLDWVALKELYDFTKGADWKTNSNWDTIFTDQSIPSPNCNLDSLYGVDLNDEGRVVALNLSRNSLIGALPKEIGNLRYLDSLNLEYNGLQKSIPSTIGNLKTLRYLNLGQNGLSGLVPGEIKNLQKLTELDLHLNNLEGPFPDDIGNLTELTYLNLYDNELKENIPSTIGNLVKLVDLNIAKNKLRGIPKEIGNLNKLKTLSLNDNELSGIIPSRIGHLINLERLNLRSNQFIGPIPLSIGNLIKLKEITLAENLLTGIIPASIKNLVNANTIDLGGNQFDPCFDSELAVLCKKPSTFFFGIQDEWWEEFCRTGASNCDEYIPDCSCYPNEWKVLKKLYEQTNGPDCNYNPRWCFTFKGKTAPSSKCDLSNLDGVYLNSTGRIESLSLFSYNLKGPLIAEISELKHLKFLKLDNNQLTGNIPPEIGNLEKLERLYLNDNQLTGNIPSEIGNLKKLHRLRLSGNKLTGNLPESIKNLPLLEDLEFDRHLIKE